MAEFDANVGISDVRAGLLQADKVEHVRNLLTAGHQVLLVGDGVAAEYQAAQPRERNRREPPWLLAACIRPAVQCRFEMRCVDRRRQASRSGLRRLCARRPQPSHG